LRQPQPETGIDSGGPENSRLRNGGLRDGLKGGGEPHAEGGSHTRKPRPRTETTSTKKAQRCRGHKKKTVKTTACLSQKEEEKRELYSGKRRAASCKTVSLFSGDLLSTSRKNEDIRKCGRSRAVDEIRGKGGQIGTREIFSNKRVSGKCARRFGKQGEVEQSRRMRKSIPPWHIDSDRDRKEKLKKAKDHSTSGS